MNLISNILYWISTGLLVPVIVLLIYFFLRSLVLTGGFFGQYLSVRKNGKKIHDSLEGLTVDNIGSLPEALPTNGSLSMNYIRQIVAVRDNKAKMEKLLGEFEIAADKDLGISKTMTKMGPMLGLMGTLIPMGPALVGLSTGDISSMAYNMQVAFATTVVGLFVSAIGFLTAQVKQRWYLQDMTDMEYIVDLASQSVPCQVPQIQAQQSQNQQNPISPKSTESLGDSANKIAK